jgi:uncharacterized protein (TIGR03437 family)
VLQEKNVRIPYLMIFASAYAGSLLAAPLLATPLLATPAISGVTNAAGNLPPGLPNSGIAQGAIFAVYGTGLGPASLQQAQSFPLPTTQGLAGTTVQVSVAGVTESCIMLYSVATQVAAVLPSATPVGTGTLTVSYQGSSASIPIQVAAAGFGTSTLNEGGTGPAVVTNAAYIPITMVNPAHPGDTLILWGTGLGAVTGDETEPPSQVDLHTGVQVFIAGQPATVLYGGRSADPGLDQINFTVPPNVTGGCRTSIAVLEKGVVGNVTTMAVAPAGQSTCADQEGLLTAGNLQQAVTTGFLKTGNVTLYHFGTNDDMLASEFSRYSLDQLIRSYGGNLGASPGSCTAYESLNNSIIIDPIQPQHLDAGPALAIQGPAGNKSVAGSSTGLYSASLGASSSYIEPGSYTVSNGAGGADVGTFNWAVTLPASLHITNLPAIINRSQNLTLTWSNNSSFAAVGIFIVAGVPLTSSQTSYVEIYCTAPAAAGQFTIPSVILSLLPTNGYGSPGQPGAAVEIAGIAASSFSGSTAPGIDAGLFSAFTYNGAIANVQ